MKAKRPGRAVASALRRRQRNGRLNRPPLRPWDRRGLVNRLAAQRLTATVGIPAAALSVALAGFGACSATAGGASSCTGGDTAPGVSGKEVRLGVLYPDSGPAGAAFPAARAGIDARIAAANAAGGIYGRKIVYDWRDDEGIPARNLTGSRELVEDENVFGLVEFTVAAEGGAAYLADRRIPVVGLADESVWTRYSNMFTPASSVGAAVDTYGGIVARHGGTTAFLLRTGLSAGISGAIDRVGQSLQAAGVRVVADQAYTDGADDPATVARQIIDSGADTIVAMLAPQSLPAVLHAVRAAGGNPPVVLSFAGYDRDLLRTAGPDLAGVLLPVGYRPFEAGGAPIARYLDAMHRYAPQVTNPAQESGIMSYIDTDLFLRGLRAAGPCPTRASFLAGMRTLTHYDADGLIPPINVVTAQRHPTSCLAVLRVNPAGNAFDVDQNNVCGHELGPDT
ncbi:ABC transporter substrate-binding protein [Frankia sp. AgB32]|uniref:ABC transporter substrate-binding protein n=1 Tax=Frankia sp. AgB32 TaxID=631119 RepID=UPI00200D67DA|nr:ABC transporter substrate-binding protein [Frankia sp. AgB32]MCK9898321.1 ABC transporter substrate-binding protein [Frankia sp. AgB32]